MRLHYYPETDSLYIELKSTPGAETREIVEGLTVDLDASGDVVGFDIDGASRKFDRLRFLLRPPPSERWARLSGPVRLTSPRTSRTSR